MEREYLYTFPFFSCTNGDGDDGWRDRYRLEKENILEDFCSNFI